MDAKSIINSMDTDGDSKISRKEAQGPILQMFDQIDTNSDSLLTENEINISMNSLKDSSQIGVVKNEMVQPILQLLNPMSLYLIKTKLMMDIVS